MSAAVGIGVAPADAAAADTGALLAGADLHTHSTASDGLLSPAALVREAVSLGLAAIALTDHDTVAGLPAARAAADAEALAADVPFEVIAGVELSTGGQGDEPEVHLLGLFVDPTDPALLAGLAAYARSREVRMERMLARLADLGLPIDPSAVRRQAAGGTLGRPHLARALVEAGHAEDLPDAFDRFLGRGQPAFVPRPKVEPADGVALLRRAGGVPTLAHPAGFLDLDSDRGFDLDALVRRLLPAGLLAIEVDYGDYDAATRDRLRAAAERHGLIPAGGSDYHGPAARAGRRLGQPRIAPDVVERLRRAAGRPAPAPAPA